MNSENTDKNFSELSDTPSGLSDAVYAKLRLLARQQMAGEQPGITLQPTALVHEAYVRLLRDPTVTWNNDADFFWAAAQSMRRVLIDSARKRRTMKRGGDRRRVPLEDGSMSKTDDERADDHEPVELLDHALDGLRVVDARLHQVVMLRYFAGLSVETTAETLGIAPRTVRRDWVAARSWLRLRMRGVEVEGLDG